jgi:hypothetical protein
MHYKSKRNVEAKEMCKCRLSIKKDRMFTDENRTFCLSVHSFGERFLPAAAGVCFHVHVTYKKVVGGERIS